MRALRHMDAPDSLPRVPVGRLVGHDGPVQVVRFTENGKYCFTGGYDRTVRLWNPARLDPAYPPLQSQIVRTEPEQDVPLESIPRALPIQTYTDGVNHPVSALAIDDASTTLATASDKTLVITNVVTKQVTRRLHGHVSRINAVCVSQGGETFLTASYDATVRIWDGRSRSHEPIQILKEAKDSVTDIHLIHSKDVTCIRTSSVDGIVRTYDLRRGCIQCDDCKSPVTSMTPTRDGECVVVSCVDGWMRLLDSKSGQLLNTFGGHHKAGQYGLGCAVTADDATVVSGSEDGRAALYDLVRATCVQELSGHSRPTCSVTAHPDRAHNSVLITASYDGSGVVWANDYDFMRWE